MDAKLWLAEATEMFVGRQIVSCRFLTAAEAEALGWERRPLVMTLDDGTLLIPSSDMNASNAGNWLTGDSKIPIFPSLNTDFH